MTETTTGPDGSDGVTMPPLEAATAEEFLALLRALVDASGRTRGQIVSVSGLPRSTVYHFTSEKNSSLPKNPDQVREFCRACKLGPDAVATVLEIWTKLSGEDAAGSIPKTQPFTITLGDSDSVRSGNLVIQRRSRFLPSSAWQTFILVLCLVVTGGAVAIGVSSQNRANEYARAVAARVVPPDAVNSGNWQGLPDGGTWYDLPGYRPTSGTGGSAAGLVNIGGLAYPNALLFGGPDTTISRTFALSRACMAFSSLVGVDDDGSSVSPTQFTVSTDGRAVVQVSRTVHEVPVSVSFPITGISELTLATARPTDGRDSAAAWVGARVYCTVPPGPKI